MSTDRLQRERLYHDHAVGEQDVRRHEHRYYRNLRAIAAFQARQIGDLRDRHVLDYGCGIGFSTLRYLEAGARVTAIDLSPILVGKLQRAAEARGWGDRLTARAMNAEALDLPDGTFDRVLGHGILHHLDLSRALAEVRRVLKPTGRAVFVEPLGTNPLINLYRRLTPESRTVDERPLTRGDLALVRRTFPDATYRYFELTSLLGLAATAIGWEGGERLARYVLEPLDDWILNQLGGFRALAWQAVLTLPLS